VAATHESGEPAHIRDSFNSSASVWYSWTAPANGSLELLTQGSTFDTLLAVYSGSSVDSLTALAGNDDNGGGGNWSRVTLDVAAGTTYKIVIDGYNRSSGLTRLSGNFTAVVPPVPVPDTAITAWPGSTTTDTRPSFSFNSDQAEATFECQIDSGAWTGCDSPFRPASALSLGLHSFTVRASLGAGNTDQTPASVAFTIQKPAPVIPPTPTPPTLTPGTFTPLSTMLPVTGRTAQLALTCVPASASGTGRGRARARAVATDGPCRGWLQLATTAGTTKHYVRLAAAGEKVVNFQLSASLARSIARGARVTATLKIYQGPTPRLVTVTLRKMSAAARNRLLAQARK
jgi:hypothetical protein